MIRNHLFAIVTLTLSALMWALSVPLARNVESSSQSRLQTFPREGSVRRIPVNARSITALPNGKKYLVDLTQRGVKYEFDPQAGQIDFNRVVVRTTQGEVAISSFLEKTFLREKLAGFNYASQSFSLEVRAPGSARTPPSGTSALNQKPNVECGTYTCICKGGDACSYLIVESGLCNGLEVLCWRNGPTGETFCSCIRR
jgi:hypothetical protein